MSHPSTVRASPWRPCLVRTRDHSRRAVAAMSGSSDCASGRYASTASASAPLPPKARASARRSRSVRTPPRSATSRQPTAAVPYSPAFA